MRFSNKSVYALRALFDLAYHGGEQPVQVKEISDREGIPTRYLEQIFQDLKRADLVTSKRGPKGGYRLAEDPETISVLRVLDAIDELPGLPDLGDDVSFVADDVCDELVGRMNDVLADVTLTDMMTRGEELGVARECYEKFVYVI